MPFVTVKIARGHSIEKKRQLVEALTNALVSALDTKPEWITIHIDEFERENWAVSGLLHSDRHRGRHDETGR
ncbi:4-oxalocrotonate tautomerase [Nostoc minutum NIES-26]|uniref:Tautomerase n=1 Tax=Nostoc minutum NIES-26 TaxID=1844469 RepID=A0A367QYR5_9NOSO|nr:4-oxalocrotonate tautomerase [Nostoc minutum NIES-26]